MKCKSCWSPAKWDEKEQVWRHDGKPYENTQFLCDKYGYPIEVEPMLGEVRK